MAWLALLLAWALGWVWVQYALPARNWAGWLFNAALGLATGIGVTSFAFFALLWMGFGSLWLELVMLASVAWLIWKRRVEKVELAKPNWILALAAALALGFAVAGVADRADRNPHGQPDAWKIWNLKAKYLAGPDEAWKAAASREPLLLPGAVARAWRWSGETDSNVPKLLGFALFLCVPGVVFGALARLRGWNAALLGVAALPLSQALLAAGPAQSAEVPLSLFLAGAAACALLRQFELGGLLVSCAAWTKDEGLVFAAAYLLLTRRRESWTGALPGLAVVAAFKLWLAHGAFSFNFGWTEIWPAAVILVIAKLRSIE